MNNDTVLKCAQMAADKQRAFIGVVDQDIQDLITELTGSAAKAPAAPVVQETAEK